MMFAFMLMGWKVRIIQHVSTYDQALLRVLVNYTHAHHLVMPRHDAIPERDLALLQSQSR